jgi:hypothetical protein
LAVLAVEKEEVLVLERRGRRASLVALDEGVEFRGWMLLMVGR